MKHLFIALALAFSASAQSPTPTNHVDLTTAIIEFLSRTELCLNSCQDEASAQAAIPQLLELKKECDTLVETQRALPEPTIQDYMAVQNQMEAFTIVIKVLHGHLTGEVGEHHDTIIGTFFRTRIS